MKNNPVNEGVISVGSKGIGPVSRSMVHKRASELARIEGRQPYDVSQYNYEQAKRELTGESDIDRQEALLNALPESERWDPFPGSAGHETPGAQSEDEDDEGRSETEQLVQQGVDEADHEQMLEASKITAPSHRPPASDP